NRDLIISDNWQEDKNWNLAKTKLCGTICDSCGDTYVGFSYDKFTTENVKKCRDLIIERFNYKMFTSTAQYVDVVLKTFGDLDGKK
ncbi:MAG: hypothetical protein B6V02_03240, partial [Thermoprotei archaeon ex4572_64]